MISPTDLLFDLPDVSLYLAGIPVIESRLRSWRDPYLLINRATSFNGKTRQPVLIVGDTKFFQMQLQARNDAIAIVREGLRDWIEYLEAAEVDWHAKPVNDEVDSSRQA